MLRGDFFGREGRSVTQVKGVRFLKVLFDRMEMKDQAAFVDFLVP